LGRAVAEKVLLIYEWLESSVTVGLRTAPFPYRTANLVLERAGSNGCG